MILDNLDLDKNDGPFWLFLTFFGFLRSHAAATSGLLEILNINYIIHNELCFNKMLAKVHFKRNLVTIRS